MAGYVAVTVGMTVAVMVGMTVAVTVGVTVAVTIGVTVAVTVATGIERLRWRHRQRHINSLIKILIEINERLQPSLLKTYLFDPLEHPLL